MQKQNYNCYSVDASVMIDLKDLFPIDIFQSVWDEIDRLVKQNRWKIFETVAGELKDLFLINWLSDHDSTIVNFNPYINYYMNKFMAECQNNSINLVNANSTRNNGDPFVIVLALFYEYRDLNDLHTICSENKCCVLTNELPKNQKVNIPYVCDYYNIDYMSLYDFMRFHGWQMSLNVNNP